MAARFPSVTLTLAAAAMAVFLLPAATPALQFDRSALSHGEVWRWLTGHLTHFDSNHLTWDVAALLALGYTTERSNPIRYRLGLLLAALVIPGAIWLWQPQLATYRGLSGLDSAAAGVLAARLLLQDAFAPKLAGGAALVALSLKCAMEVATQQTVFAAGISYVPVPLAHALGLLAGFIAGVWPARLLPAALFRQPLRRLVHETRFLERRRHQPPTRLAGVDRPERA